MTHATTHIDMGSNSLGSSLGKIPQPMMCNVFQKLDEENAAHSKMDTSQDNLHNVLISFDALSSLSEYESDSDSEDDEEESLERERACHHLLTTSSTRVAPICPNQSQLKFQKTRVARKGKEAEQYESNSYWWPPHMSRLINRIRFGEYQVGISSSLLDGFRGLDISPHRVPSTCLHCAPENYRFGYSASGLCQAPQASGSGTEHH